MKHKTLIVEVATDGDAEWLARSLAQHLTNAEGPFVDDYAENGEYAIKSGYDGPFVRFVMVTPKDGRYWVESWGGDC